MQFLKPAIAALIVLVFLPLGVSASIVDDDYIEIVNDKAPTNPFKVDPGPPPGSIHNDGPWSYVFFPENIEIAYHGPDVTFNIGDGIHFKDVDWGGVPGDITAIRFSANNAGYDVSELTFHEIGNTGVWEIWLEVGGPRGAPRSVTWKNGYMVELRLDVTHVPEPSTFVLVGFGLGMAALVSRRKQKK